jgi:hypothetical protein
VCASLVTDQGIIPYCVSVMSIFKLYLSHSCSVSPMISTSVSIFRVFDFVSYSSKKEKAVFGLGVKHSVRSGNSTRSWVDWWSCRTPFKFRFPFMFAISNELEASVAKCHEADGVASYLSSHTRPSSVCVELVTLDARDWRDTSLFPGALRKILGMMVVL